MIGGPTAVGKTGAAIRLALHFNTAIISADSRQCYRELNIGVARPSEEELSTVPHHFIASHSIHEPVTAAFFEDYALQKSTELFNEKDVIVMAGGTGLYLKAFAEGLDFIPEVPVDVRNEIIEQYKLNGLAWLQQEVKEKDPVFYESGEILNPQRLMRALEVVRATGKSLLHFRTGIKKEREFRVIKLGLELPKEKLHANINSRVNKMIKEGLVEEARELRPFRVLNALNTVGYKELFEYFDELTTLEAAIDAIKNNTKQYAKRQLTWFKKDKTYQWLQADEFDQSFLEKISKSL